MVNSIGIEVLSITTGKPQNLFLDGKDRKKIRGKKVMLLDDVISTGETLKGMRALMKKAGAKIIGVSLKIDGYLFNMDANNKLLTDWANTLKV